MEDFYNNFYTKYDDLDIMYKYTSLNIKNNAQVISNYCHIFNSGYEEYEAAKNVCFNANDVSLSIDNIAGAMDISTLENESFLKKNLTILSTIGSNSPYIGLFGTVLGIMNAFSSLSGINEQVTIAMIAPGISEALIATAMGLLAAIPAVIGYNKLIDSISEAMHKSSSITEDFVIIFRKKLLININDNI